MGQTIDQSIDLDKLEDSSHLLDVLIGLEEILDSMDMYCYPFWFDGEVVEGPIVRRHWVTFSLLYPYRKMPDPRAALRLLKHGVQVEYNKVKQQEAGEHAGEPDKEPKHFTHWLIKITVPRRLLDQMEAADLELYDDEVDSDDVTAAKDIGLDQESQYQTDEQLETPPEEGVPPGQPPQGGAPNAPPRF
jgi:hypothetical protein